MRTIRRIRRAPAPNNDRGAAMVEFALVLPILLLLLTGIIDAGYLFGQKLALNQAVREGARNAVVQSSSGKNVTTLVRDAAGSSLISSPENIVVTGPASGPLPSCSTVKYGNDLTVEAAYATSGLINFIPGFSDVDLDAQATFRCEWE